MVVTARHPKAALYWVMGKKIDWDKWRRKYVQGTELDDLAKLQGAPAYGSLRNRSSKENWPEQRQRFNDNTMTVAATVTPEVQDVARTVDRIIDSAEMLTRHAGAAKQIGSIALKAFKSYDPADLSPRDAVAMMKLAIEVERITEGMVTERVENTGDMTLNVNVNRRVMDNADS